MGVAFSVSIIVALLLLFVVICILFSVILSPSEPARRNYARYRRVMVAVGISFSAIIIVLSAFIVSVEYKKGEAITYSDLEQGTIFVVLTETDKEFLNNDVPDENLKIYLTIMAEGDNVVRLLCAGNGMEYYETLVFLKNGERFTATDRGPRKI
ncbi:hypothetical protein K8R32_00495 [bacterium]|nr:hypothetical protein [bacterium]